MLLSLIGKKLQNRLINNPVFVVGQGRSGTTALRQAVSKHPEILSSSLESPVIRHYAAIVYYYFIRETQYYSYSTPIPDHIYLDKIKWDMFATFAGPDFGAGKIIKEVARSDLSHWKHTRWCAKIFPDELEYEGLNLLFPDAKYLYIFRNGIDQINSSMKHPSFSGNRFGFYCKSWLDHMNKYRYLTGKQNCLTIRHEQLVHNPGSVVENVFEHLQLHYHQSAHQFLTETLVHPLDQETQRTDVKSELTRRSNRYDAWNAQQRQLFKEICGEMMDDLGYEIPE